MTPVSPSPGRSAGGLPEFAVARPVMMLMLFLSLLVIGAIALRKVPQELFPQGLDPPFLYVWLAYPNISPEENQQRVTIPAEEALWTVEGIKRITSRTNERGSGILLEFRQNADMNSAYLGVRDRISRVRPELPDDLRYIYLWRYSQSDEPILYFGISVTGAYDDPYRVIEEEVVKPLERVDGVARVEMWGGGAKMVRIKFRLDRLRSHRVEMSRVIRDLMAANFALSAGRVEDAGSDLLVRVDQRVHDPGELERLPLRGTDLRLGDVATVTLEPPDRSWVQRIGGIEAVQIGVLKSSDANTVELTHTLTRLVERMRSNPLLKGMRFEILFDQGEYISQSLQNLQEAGLWGGLFAVGVLFFFLRRWRMTLFVSLAIPLSLLITLTVLFFMGWSLNILTLSGLMISVGLVVDNAIVVVENIQTARQGGVSAKRAAVVGASEVALAITTATMTTVVVFLPLMLMSSNRMLTFAMLRIGLPIIVALVASLLMALMFIPLAVHRLAISSTSGRSGVVDRSAAWTERLVRRALKRRGDALLVAVLLLASAGIPISRVVSTDQESGHINDLRLFFRFPSYYSLAMADSTMRRMERAIYSRADAYNLNTIVTGFRKEYGRMRIFMHPDPDRLWLMQGLRRLVYRTGLLKPHHLSRKDVIAELKEKFKPPPGVDMSASWTGGGGEKAVYVSIYGEDTATLLDIAADVKSRLTRIPEAISIDTDLEPSSDEVRLRFRRDDAARLGVDPSQAAYGITALIRGIQLPDIDLGGHDIEGRAELRAEDRRTLQQVLNLPVGLSPSGGVLLGDVADVGYERGVGEISRENRRTRLQLKITTIEDDLKKLSRAIDANLAALSLPPGYEVAKGQRFQDLYESQRERSHAWQLALMFVFLLMGALFESFLLPLCVIVTVPFSFFGVWWFLYLTGTQFGLMAGIGVVILIGVVVNNAIVLVDRANRLRSEGLPRDEALAVAARQRFRPIAMTALTTICGLLPMAVGDANLIGLPYSPMGRAMIGGMLTATLSTPLIVPLAYSLVDDFHVWLKGYAATLRGRYKTRNVN